MNLNEFIFREYDIRGKVSEDFPEEVVINLGKGFGTFIKRAGGMEIALSGDVRDSTPILKDQFKTGVLSTGVDVIELGLLPTPLNYFSMYNLEVAGAVQITGSHNPPEFNGFKMSRNKKSVFGKTIQDIKHIIQNQDFDFGTGTEAPYRKTINDYEDLILNKINIEKPIKIVMDCGNAAGALCAPRIFKKLKNVELTELYSDIDPTFPNHHPDPTVEANLVDLINEMKTGKYDIGVAFDGDADRIGVVDNKGSIIWADQLMALFLPEIINPNDQVIFDVKCSKVLEDMILKHNGKPEMWKTGHSLIKQRMAELKCKFGGEMSGHIFMADDYFGYDDAIYVAARAVQMLARSDKKLSDLKEALPKYFSTPEIRLNTESDEEKFKITNKAIDHFSSKYKCNLIDGVKILFEDGWGLIRASNTQPVIVCRFEAKNEERMIEIKNMIMDKLFQFGELKFEEG